MEDGRIYFFAQKKLRFLDIFVGVPVVVWVFYGIVYFPFKIFKYCFLGDSWENLHSKFIKKIDDCKTYIDELLLKEKEEEEKLRLSEITRKKTRTIKVTKIKYPYL